MELGQLGGGGDGGANPSGAATGAQRDGASRGQNGPAATARPGQSRRPDVAVFALAGAVLVVAGIASILTGVPVAAHYVQPLDGPAALAGRLGELSFPLSAGGAALVVVIVAGLLAAGRLRAAPARVELLVLGVAIEASLLASAHRIGYAADGGVLPAAAVCLAGGAAVILAALLADGASKRSSEG